MNTLQDTDSIRYWISSEKKAQKKALDYDLVLFPFAGEEQDED